MFSKSLRVGLFLAVGFWALPEAAWAETWADGLFSEKAHNFGLVARGAKMRHAFSLTNRLNEPITIVNLRPSCGCTSGKASSATVAAGHTATIEVEMDTRNFVGPKATALYVSLASASGQEAEVRLAITSTILSDIVLNPGSIDFGTVVRGQTPQRVMTLERLGSPEWEVTRMVSACRSLDATLVETNRAAGLVQYSLTVSLRPNAPPEAVRDEIRILTNDPETPSITVLVNALIRGELSASPSMLSLGRVVSAGGATGQVLIRGSKPFAITSVEGRGEGFSVALDDQDRKALHRLTISFRPEETAARGDLRRAFRIHTDLPGEPPLDVNAALHVDP